MAFTSRYQGIISLNNKFLKQVDLGEVTRHFGISSVSLLSVKSIIMLSAEYRGIPYNGLYRGGGGIYLIQGGSDRKGYLIQVSG